MVTRDGTWFGYVADVSGHGVSSGVVMGMFKSALRMRLLHPGPLSSLLEDLNAVLLPLKSGSMFVTVACVRGGAGGDARVLASPGTSPSCASARPHARGRGADDAADSDRRCSRTTASRPPRSQCDRGDLLALITDGLTEVFDARDEQFGMDAVKAILGRLADRPLAEISQADRGGRARARHADRRSDAAVDSPALTAPIRRRIAETADRYSAANAPHTRSSVPTSDPAAPIMLPA